MLNRSKGPAVWVREKWLDVALTLHVHASRVRERKLTASCTSSTCKMSYSTIPTWLSVLLACLISSSTIRWFRPVPVTLSGEQ